jgi:CBS-domain-containing membrane protein
MHALSSHSRSAKTAAIMLTRIFHSLGIEAGITSHTERVVSALGGFIVILLIFHISRYFLGAGDMLLIVPSMGASAVLLFAVPHGALSQPWNVLGGHVISAIIGVSCALLLPEPFIAASLAVGLAIGAMYYLRCIHPPGGATALTAVIGGDATHALGYQFVLTPVLLNALVMVLVAVLFNYFFTWRRYPASLAQRGKQPATEAESAAAGTIRHEDLVVALSEIDSYIDVSESDLLRIYEIATGKAEQRHLAPVDIIPGHYYSNDAFGDEWSIRQIVDENPHASPDRDMVVYKVVAGSGQHKSGVLTRGDFARWARHEVQRDDENWKRIKQSGA